MEDGLRQPARKRVYAVGRIDERGERAALVAPARGQLDTRKQLGARHRDVRIGGDELLFGLSDVRSARQQLRRQSGEHRRALELGQCAAGHIDRLRRLADQHRERVDRLTELLLRAAEWRRTAGPPWFPAVRHRGRSPCRRTVRASKPRRIVLAVREILLRHLNPIAQLQRLKIGGGNARDHGQCDGLPVVAAGDGGGARRIARRAVLAPEIELIARGEHGIEDVVQVRSILADIRPLARRRRAQIDRRQERRTRDARLRVRLLDASDRAGQIVVAALAPPRSTHRAAPEPKPCHQSAAGQTAAALAAPPPGKGAARGASCHSCGRADVGPLVGRAHAAGGERARTAIRIGYGRGTAIAWPPPWARRRLTARGRIVKTVLMCARSVSTGGASRVLRTFAASWSTVNGFGRKVTLRSNVPPRDAGIRACIRWCRAP